MKILIIATWFYPDTAIGAKRPYYFAKYLSQFGHDVTVLRSGGILESIDPILNPRDSGFRIQSYLGPNSPAEKYERGEAVLSAEVAKRNFDFLPDWIRSPLVAFYRQAFPALRFLDWKNKSQKRWVYLKGHLDTLKTAGESFDIVFATYSELENMWAGEYAAGLFSCPWVMDLRDPITAHWAGNWGCKQQQQLETMAIRSAAACTTISQGMTNTYQLRYPGRRILAIHNGYDAQEGTEKAAQKSARLSFCYTGALYEGKRDLSALFAALQKLSANHLIDLAKVQVNYAGRDFPELLRQAEKYSMTSILVNHGYVSKTEAVSLQDAADYFVVASWNTEEEQGVLTGKFYEGIRAGKPILSFVTGPVPDCELYLMNEVYHYGFCYEDSKKSSQFQELCDYLKEAYSRKMQSGAVPYCPEPGLAVDFRYDQLTKKLETLLCDIIAEA